MNVSQMLERLRENGLTEARIAEELGVCQSSVNKIRRGIIKNPLHSTVRGIEILYHIVLSQKSEYARGQ
jgi:transcriptional regulator with XRE-family HTH domain